MIQPFKNIILSPIFTFFSPSAVPPASKTLNYFAFFTGTNLLICYKDRTYQIFDNLIIINLFLGLSRILFPISKILAIANIASTTIIILMLLLKGSYKIIKESNIKTQKSFFNYLKAIYSTIKEKMHTNKDDLMIYAFFILSSKIITEYLCDFSSFFKNLSKLITTLLLMILCIYIIFEYIIKHNDPPTESTEELIQNRIRLSTLEQQLIQRNEDINNLEEQLQRIIVQNTQQLQPISINIETTNQQTMPESPPPYFME